MVINHRQGGHLRTSRWVVGAMHASHVNSRLAIGGLQQRAAVLPGPRFGLVEPFGPRFGNADARAAGERQRQVRVLGGRCKMLTFLTCIAAHGTGQA